jgi:hypothetical protein
MGFWIMMLNSEDRESMEIKTSPTFAMKPNQTPILPTSKPINTNTATRPVSSPWPTDREPKYLPTYAVYFLALGSPHARAHADK